jgi:hypothetical protein
MQAELSVRSTSAARRGPEAARRTVVAPYAMAFAGSQPGSGVPNVPTG